jgi:hypothetical protein
LSSTSGVQATVYIETRKRILERRTLHLITVTIQTIYYALGIASILCGAAYKIGYEIGKNAKK